MSSNPKSSFALITLIVVQAPSAAYAGELGLSPGFTKPVFSTAQYAATCVS